MAAAATLPFLSVDEYLHSSYEPDADYVNGMLDERIPGKWDHADLQGEIVTLFRMNAKAWALRAVVEIRIQTSTSRFRIADVGIISASAPREQIVRTPPVFCIEILSPEDRLTRSLTKFNDYLDMGVREVWVFDPASRVVYVMKQNVAIVTRSEGALTLRDTPIEVDIAGIFAVLDQQ